MLSRLESRGSTMRRTAKQKKALAGLPVSMDQPWRRILESRPNRAPQCSVVVDVPDRVELRVQGQKPAYLVPPLSWIIRPRLTHTHHLDPLGIKIWRLCDGKRTFEEIVDQFAQANKLTFHESRIAVMQYIHILMQRGILIVEVPLPQ